VDGLARTPWTQSSGYIYRCWPGSGRRPPPPSGRAWQCTLSPMFRRRGIAVVLGLAVISCGSGTYIQAGSSLSAGVVSIPSTGVYDYVLLSDCLPFYSVRLLSASGAVRWLPQQEYGQVELIAGEWRGAGFYRPRGTQMPCTWRLSLTLK
jgi:hypothetical protein